MKKSARDIYSGSVFLVLSILLYLVIPGQVETLESENLTPAFIPETMAISIGLLSLILLGQGIRNSAPVPGQPVWEPGGLKYVVAVILVAIGYTVLMPWVGYLVSTSLALGILCLIYGNRNWLQIIIIMIVCPPIIKIFFRYTMLVLLPKGSIFG